MEFISSLVREKCERRGITIEMIEYGYSHYSEEYSTKGNTVRVGTLLNGREIKVTTNSQQQVVYALLRS